MTQRAEIRHVDTLPLKLAISKHLSKLYRSRWRDRRRKKNRALPHGRIRKEEDLLRIRKFVVTTSREFGLSDEVLEDRRRAAKGAALHIPSEDIVAPNRLLDPNRTQDSPEEDLACNMRTPDPKLSELSGCDSIQSFSPSSNLGNGPVLSSPSESSPYHPSPTGIRISKQRRRNQKKKAQRAKLKQESKALSSVRRELSDPSGLGQAQSSPDASVGKITVSQAPAQEFQWGEFSESFTISPDLDVQDVDSSASSLPPPPGPQSSRTRPHDPKRKAQPTTLHQELDSRTRHRGTANNPPPQEDEAWHIMLSELSGDIPTSLATASTSNRVAAAAGKYLDTVPRGTVLHRFLKDLEAQDRHPVSSQQSSVEIGQAKDRGSPGSKYEQ